MIHVLIEVLTIVQGKQVMFSRIPQKAKINYVIQYRLKLEGAHSPPLYNLCMGIYLELVAVS